MQNLIYDQAVYDILYYDASLAAYRTDRFAGWRNMPDNGTPIFTYGTLTYTMLTDATLAPTPGPSVSASGAPATAGPAATPSPSGTPTGNPGGGDMTPLLLVGGAALIAVIGGVLYMNRRRAAAAVEDE